MCLLSALGASWFLTQEMAGWNPFTVMTNILSANSANSKKIGKLKCPETRRAARYQTCGEAEARKDNIWSYNTSSP